MHSTPCPNYLIVLALQKTWGVYLESNLLPSPNIGILNSFVNLFEIRGFLQKYKQYSGCTQNLSGEIWTHFSPASKQKSYVLQLHIPLDVLKQTNKINRKAPPYITASWWIDFWMYRVELASQSYRKSMSTEGQIPVWVFPPNCTQLPLPRLFFQLLEYSISNNFFSQDIFVCIFQARISFNLPFRYLISLG